MLKNVVRRLALAAAAVAALSCASVVAGPGSPEPCEADTDEELEDLERMILAGDYPGVESIVSKLELYCTEMDAVADREGWDEEEEGQASP